MVTIETDPVIIETALVTIKNRHKYNTGPVTIETDPVTIEANSNTIKTALVTMETDPVIILAALVTIKAVGTKAIASAPLETPPASEERDYKKCRPERETPPSSMRTGYIKHTHTVSSSVAPTSSTTTDVSQQPSSQRSSHPQPRKDSGQRTENSRFIRNHLTRLLQKQKDPKDVSTRLNAFCVFDLCAVPFLLCITTMGG